MRVCEKNAAGGQAVKIGSLGLWISTKAAYPIVEIIHSDKEDIWSSGSVQRSAAKADAQSSEKFAAIHEVPLFYSKLPISDYRRSFGFVRKRVRNGGGPERTHFAF